MGGSQLESVPAHADLSEVSTTRRGQDRAPQRGDQKVVQTT